MCSVFSLHSICCFRLFLEVHSLEMLVLLSEERPKHFPWEHFQIYCRYHLSLKMSLWSKEYLSPFYNLTSLRKGHWGKAGAIAVQKFMPIGLFECCMLTMKAFQSLTVLILGWNGLELQNGINFCCSIPCFQPNTVMFWHFLPCKISRSLLTFYSQSKY